MDEIDAVLRKRGITCPPDLPWEQLDAGERWLTKEEALAWLWVWKEEYIPKYNLVFPPASRLSTVYTSGVRYVYLNGLVDELAKRIKESCRDPITVVADYNYEMDRMLALSDNDHYITHRFCNFMERASYEVLLFLKDREKELNRK